jgi:PAS domain S-box-containing protein
MSTSTSRILLVDDSEANRYTIARLLRRAGYTVEECGSGDQAIRSLQKPPDLVVLDVNLPDMSGMDISRLIRSNPVTRLIPILHVSATFTMTSDKVKGLDAGADAYLASPIEPEELLAHIRMLLRLKSAQDALSRSNERLKSVLGTILDVFYALDFDYRIVELNPAAEALFGKPAGTLVGKRIWQEYPSMAGSVFQQQFEAALRGKHAVHFEAESTIILGRWWEAHAYPREDKLDVYLRDITERKSSERALLKASTQLQTHISELQSAQAELARARDQLSLQNEVLEARVKERTMKLQETIDDLETFSYSITHDMRAPLRAMQGFSRILLESHGEKLDGEALEFLSRIANSANRLDMLIRDVLSYSNIVRAELKLVPVDVDRLVRDIIMDYPSFQAPQARVQVKDRLPPVLGNEAFLTQCLSNLLSNAVKFVPEGQIPEVEIAARTENGMVRLEVCDHGIGIAPEHQERLFALFHRAQTKYPGTGIGLAVVRKAIERMNGRVGVQSAPGQGSTFWLELRAADR